MLDIHDGCTEDAYKLVEGATGTVIPAPHQGVLSSQECLFLHMKADSMWSGNGFNISVECEGPYPKPPYTFCNTYMGSGGRQATRCIEREIEGAQPPAADTHTHTPMLPHTHAAAPSRGAVVLLILRAAATGCDHRRAVRDSTRHRVRVRGVHERPLVAGQSSVPLANAAPRCLSHHHPAQASTGQLQPSKGSATMSRWRGQLCLCCHSTIDVQTASARQVALNGLLCGT